VLSSKAMTENVSSSLLPRVVISSTTQGRPSPLKREYKGVFLQLYHSDVTTVWQQL